MSASLRGCSSSGRIGRPHGVRGEVYVDLLTDREDRLAVGARLWARRPELVVAASRPSNDRWLVTFEGFDRTTAERFTDAELLAEPLDDPDALWVHDLIGSRVVEVDGTRARHVRRRSSPTRPPTCWSSTRASWCRSRSW